MHIRLWSCKCIRLAVNKLHYSHKDYCCPSRSSTSGSVILVSPSSNLRFILEEANGEDLLKHTGRGKLGPKEEWIRLDMRVQVHSSSDQTKSAPAEMSENGRSRRKRVPKLCDCCGPNSKPHMLGHDQVTKKRGRRKKEVASEVEVATEKQIISNIVDLVSMPETDAMTVCEMQPVPNTEPTTALSGDQIMPLVCDSTVLLNGNVFSLEDGSKTKSKDNGGISILLDDSKEPTSLTDISPTQASLDTHSDHIQANPAVSPNCIHSSLTAHNNCTEQSAGPALQSNSMESEQTTDADAMEVEHPVSTAYLNVKALRDHRYCKRPAGSAEEEPPGLHLPSAEIQNEGIVELLHGKA